MPVPPARRTLIKVDSSSNDEISQPISTAIVMLVDVAFKSPLSVLGATYAFRVG